MAQAASSSATSYTVVYRMGGPAACQWRRALPVATYGEAETMRDNVERGGRKALIFETAILNVVGMPEGWDAADIRDVDTWE
jgi:hypothetical protein